ncbi:MAG TPA: branched-chain amino acid ABC transporter permease [Pirellulales bacterium]|jgi:branched-chain amino acid transport system permease protein|nr:branched-chain amino acid ABC transporter permease [Pirellulales bacterium]
MSTPRDRSFSMEWFYLALVLIYPLLVYPENALFRWTEISLGMQLTYIFIYAILALGLNVVVGFTGLLHLGIAAFFGIGAYITGILNVPAYPFQIGFFWSMVCSTLGAALLGVLLGAPTLRLRGDYLAIVTLGFGEVTRFTLRNLEEITAGTRGLNPVPPPVLPAALAPPLEAIGILPDWSLDYRLFYYLTLGILLAVILLLRNLERSRLGRAWVAIREDELAATCMGINAARVKLSAFALGCGLAGLAGSLYATTLTSTAGPDAFDFNRSIIMLCCIILGGLGSIRGTLLGVVLLIGFDNILAPMLDGMLQNANINPNGSPLLTFSSWKLAIFGLALILMMRFRPEGLLPSRHVEAELLTKRPLGHPRAGTT